MATTLPTSDLYRRSKAAFDAANGIAPAPAPIDLSAGFVPKQQPASVPIDISAGLIPKAQMDATGQGSTPDYGPGTTTVNPTLGQIATGVGREGAQLASGAYGFGRRTLDLIPGVEGSAVGQQMQHNQQTLDAAAQPRNLGEDMGKVGGEVGSFLLPAPAESALAGLAPEELRFLARIGASSLSSGTMNAMNGGSFGAGAAVGAGGAVLGEAGRAVAPQLVRSAIPGNSVTGKISTDAARALLDETRSVRPRSLLPEVTNRIADAANDLQSRVSASDWASVPLQPAIEPVQRYLDLAAQERVPTNADQIQNIMDFLRGTGDYGPLRSTIGGHPLVGPVGPGASTPLVGGDVVVSPQETLDARRGLDKNFLSSAKWEKVANPDATAAAKLAYGELTRQLHFAVPGSEEADELMSKLIPVQTGLKTLVKNDPSIVQNVTGRMAARTGALTSAVAGGAAGLQAGGVPGAIAGGALGLVAPEVLTSPASKILLARALSSTAAPVAARSGALMTPRILNLLAAIRGSDRQSPGQ